MFCEPPQNITRWAVLRRASTRLFLIHLPRTSQACVFPPHFSQLCIHPHAMKLRRTCMELAPPSRFFLLVCHLGHPTYLCPVELGTRTRTRTKRRQVTWQGGPHSASRTRDESTLTCSGEWVPLLIVCPGHLIVRSWKSSDGIWTTLGGRDSLGFAP